MDRALEDEEEGQALIAIREALSGTAIRVSQHHDNGLLFSDIDSFVKLSEGNTSITEVRFHPCDKKGDDELWEKVGEGLANLKSLERFIVYSALANELPNPRADFGILGLVLPYLRQNFSFIISSSPVFLILLQQEAQVQALARAIRRHPTIKEFVRCCAFPVETFHIILSALATLPSLEAVHLGLKGSESSHFRHPETLKKLMLSPSLREVFFDDFTFCRPLCRALEEALQGESKVTLLYFYTCAFPIDRGDRIARALKQNSTLTDVSISGNFSQAFYDAFAAALLINTTLTNLRLQIPDDEAEAASIAPVFLALGMNKALKKLEVTHYPSSAVPVYNAIRDGLEKNSALEILHIRTRSAEDFSVYLLSRLLPFLRLSTNLKTLNLDFTQRKPHPHVTTSCLAIVSALRENSSLENLKIQHRKGFKNYGANCIAPDTYMTALESVQMNTTLKKLCLSPVLASFGNDEMKRVVSLVKKNYVLSELDEGISACDKTGELGSILRLNQAGRRYLIDDAGSIPKGVEVLIDVRDDLGCLFYHLLENPTLCDIECQYEPPGVLIAKGGSHGTKRARLTH